MADTNITILSILRYYFKIGHKAAEAALKIRELDGKYTISDSTAQKWVKCFKKGDLSLKMKLRSRKTSLAYLEDLKSKV